MSERKRYGSVSGALAIRGRQSSRLELATDRPIKYRRSNLMHGLTELPVRCCRD